MKYSKLQPSVALRSVVQCYYVLKGIFPEEGCWIDSPPNSYTAIVFNLSGDQKLSLDKGQVSTMPPAFLSGQCIRNYAIRFASKIDQIGIVFKPTGLFKLFGLQMYEFSNIRMDIELLLKEEFRNVFDKLQDAPSVDTRVKILEKTLLAQLGKREINPDGVDFAAQQIIDHRGNVNIGDLVLHSCMSRRTFERHFFQRVGLSPKFYGRVRRFGYVCSLMAGQRQVEWDRLIYQVGYFDQSHFIRDFKEFTGQSPQHYLQHNSELAHLVKPNANAT